MFGRNRNQATQHVTEALRPLIGIFQNTTGVPREFWHDEYVLGFLGFMMSFHANFTSGVNLSQLDKGRLSVDVFTALSNMNGKVIMDRYIELATAADRSETFEAAADNASICAAVSVGKLPEGGRQAFDDAKRIAALQGNGDDLAAVAGILMHQLFYAPVRQRLFPNNGD